jgi:hypothetical protein
MGLSLFFLFFPGNLHAQTGRDRGDYLTVKIAVRGPGDEIYYWWGHIALVIDDAATGRSRFYDYGLFSFENDNFFRNFAFGRLLYSCGVSDAAANYAGYKAANRDITVYTLDLPAAAREKVWRFVEWNVRPENRSYYYHHFRDNCATRVRDIVDMAVGGQFKERFGEAPGRYTLRRHVRRHTWFSPFWDWALNFWMGRGIDRPITVWEEMFLPSEIGARISGFTYTDDSGLERRLVSSVEVLNRAVDRPPVLDVPPAGWSRELVIGLLMAAFSLFFSVLEKKNPLPGRILRGLSQSLLGLFFGTAGSLLFFMVFFTNHDYTYGNINLLFINPLLLAAVPLGIVSALGGDAGRRFVSARLLRGLWTYVFLGGLFTMAIKALPGFYQQNQATLALVLPFSLVLSFIPGWIHRKRKVRNG